MIIYVTAGLLAGLLLASVSANLYLLRHPVAAAWADRARAAESQLQGLLERVSTAERLDLSPVNAAPVLDPTVKRYIPDTPDADAAWNEWRGEPVEVEE
jgi:hypothetical protein